MACRWCRKNLQDRAQAYKRKKKTLCRERGARALEERLAVAQKAAAEAEDGKPSLPVSSKPPSTSSGKQPPLKEKAPADEAV
jgi:hypothetical protein